MTSSVYILGARGFIGGALASRLRAAGFRVSPTGDTRQERLREPREFTSIVDSHDWIVHAASSSTPSSSAGSPLLELEENLRAMLSLTQALQANPACSVVFFSSAGTLYSDQSQGPIQEWSEIRPRSYHGAAKAASEAFLHALSAQYGNRVVIIRPSNVYGPGQVARPGFGIIPTAFERALRGESITIWGDGSSVRDYLYIDDLVELTMRAISIELPLKFTSVNASTGLGHPLTTLLGLVERVTGKPLQVEYRTARMTDASQIVPDATLARERYHWTARTDLESGLARTFDWLLRTKLT